MNVPGHVSHACASRRAAPAVLALLMATGLVWAAAGPWLAPALAREIRTTATREVRGLWVQRGTLSSPAAIARMVGEAAGAGFNTLLVQVRGRGDAFFAGGIDPRAAALSAQPSSYDPLATVLAAARAAGLHVHLWINVNLVADATRLPDARTHVVHRHPEWLMVPRALAADLARVDPNRPEYLDRLARHTRDHAARVEGLYLSPIHDEAVEYTASVVADLVRRYDVDGIHLDYIRYPNDEFDYSPAALARFRRDVAADLGRADRERYDRRLEVEPTVYADAFPERWHAFRRAKLTRLVTRLREAATTGRPGTLLSASVLPDAHDAFARRLQDWQQWAALGLLDVVCPMAYTADAGTFRTQIAAVGGLAGGRPVWAGIGAYRLSSSETIENILAARATGASGVILFSYDNLMALPGRPELLRDIGRAAFD